MRDHFQLDRVEVPNPQRPSAFQRGLAAWASGSLVGMLAMVVLIRLLPPSLPPGGGWLLLAVPLVAVLLVYRLLDRAWPERLALERSGGEIRGAGKAVELPVGSGVVTVLGDYGRTPRGLRHELYTIRYLPSDGVGEPVTLRAGCTQEVRVRQFAEALCRLGGYTLHWHAPGSREREVRTPEELGRTLTERMSAQQAARAAAGWEPAGPASATTPPAGVRTRVSWLEDGTLVVRAGGVAPRSLGRATLWFLVAAAATVGLELRWPGSVVGLLVGAVAMILGLACLVWLTDTLLRHEYRFSPAGVRCRVRLLGVPVRWWSLPTSSIEELRVQDHESTLHVLGPGFRRPIHLGVMVRPGELQWVATQAEAALAGSAPSERPRSSEAVPAWGVGDDQDRAG
jgi:hypothetical protein